MVWEALVMSRIARAEVIAADEVAIVHVLNRTVRRCFPLGGDAVSGRNYVHHKRWIDQQLIHQARPGRMFTPGDFAAATRALRGCRPWVAPACWTGQRGKVTRTKSARHRSIWHRCSSDWGCTQSSHPEHQACHSAATDGMHLTRLCRLAIEYRTRDRARDRARCSLVRSGLSTGVQ